MIDILFFLDFEPGHIYPTFKMAHNLKRHGYHVAYMGVADVVENVKKEGFETYTIFEDIYPKGFIEKIKSFRMQNRDMEEHHMVSIVNGSLDALFQKLDPKLLITCSHTTTENLLLHYKYQLPHVVYWPHLPFDVIDDLSQANWPVSKVMSETTMDSIIDCDPEIVEELMMALMESGIRLKKMEDFVAPMKELHNLMMYPKALEINRTIVREKEIYLGPGIRETPKKEATELADFLPRKENQQLIFASMGSQVTVYPEKATRVFKMLVECMKRPSLQQFHLCLSTGNLNCDELFDEIPDNVSVHSWIPQIDVLQHASMAIIHGGMGSTKECVFYGVPMLAFPMGRDQPSNAIRIEHHQMGLQADADQISIDQLHDMILKINHDPSFQEGIKRMKKIFHEEEAKQHEIAFFESLLGAPTNLSTPTTVATPLPQ